MLCCSLQSSSPQTEAPKDVSTPSLHQESSSPPLEDHSASFRSSHSAPAATVPTIVISQCDPPSEPLEEVQTEKEPQPASESCSQDKAEDSDNPLASNSFTHFKMIFRGLSRSRSQESLASTKTNGDEDAADPDPAPHCGHNGDVQGESAESPSWRHFSGRSAKKEKSCFRLSAGASKAKAKEQGSSPRAEDSQGHRNQGNWEQLEATKAIFDLLKEISGVWR